MGEHPHGKSTWRRAWPPTDASAIRRTAHDAGMKYSEGRATDVSPCGTPHFIDRRASDYGKDPMKELSTECNKLGVVGLLLLHHRLDEEPRTLRNQNPIDEELMTGND